MTRLGNMAKRSESICFPASRHNSNPKCSSALHKLPENDIDSLRRSDLHQHRKVGAIAVQSRFSEAAEATASMAARMTSLARPDPLKPLVVLGPDAISLMIDLCRDGYQQIFCGCRAGLPCTLEHSSTVLISGPVTQRELKPLLHDACAFLGLRGRLVLRLASIDQDRVVEQILGELGVAIMSGVYDLSREVLVCHQVERSMPSAVARQASA